MKPAPLPSELVGFLSLQSGVKIQDVRDVLHALEQYARLSVQDHGGFVVPGIAKVWVTERKNNKSLFGAKEGETVYSVRAQAVKNLKGVLK